LARLPKRGLYQELRDQAQALLDQLQDGRSAST
jgi:hypothetical protein